MKQDQIITTVLLFVYMVIGYYAFHPDGIILFWVSMIAANMTVAFINAQKDHNAKRINSTNRAGINESKL